jgi:hypothetical protein
MNPESERPFLEKFEFVIPAGLFLLFLGFTLPGIAWGPWHPDEIVVRSIKALHGEWRFSEINFDYPDLPQYAMYFLGKAILALGGGDGEILVASRTLSAVLAGLAIVLTYFIARRIGGGVFTAGLAGLFLISVSQMSHNGRFAHNDTYVVFFTTLAILLVITYVQMEQRGWLYAAFITVGMAASSKYTGGSALLVVLVVYFTLHWRDLKSDWFRIGETLIIGGVLTYLGYALGTPKALTWMAYYFKRVFAALNWQVNYGRNPDSIRGFIGQYATLQDGLGTALYWLFVAAFLWACLQVARSIRTRSMQRGTTASVLSVVVLAIFVFDLPIMISYNYQLRYFLPMMPPLAILAAFFVADLHGRASMRDPRTLPVLLGLVIAGIVLYSFARLVSISLLFINDARITAGGFLLTLPAGSSLEHTNYPPSYPQGYFSREHNYPLYITKGSTDVVPTNKPYEFNTGEAGLIDRGTDYLIVDSFTSEGMNDPYTCEQVPVECEFFAQLETGQSEHYRLIAEFEYTLPPYLPQIRVLFANPTIRIYERIK